METVKASVEVEEAQKDRRFLCMPVGPAGIKPAVCQLVVGLVKHGAVSIFLTADAHLIPGRNSTWRAAVGRGCKRLLWLDSDVTAPIAGLVDFLDNADREFERDPKLAWVGAIYRRRGGGYAMANRDDGLLLGLGLAYWRADRVLDALKKDGRSIHEPFQWVPPYSEDYDMARLLWRQGYRVDVDERLATYHDGIGDWPGADDEPDGEIVKVPPARPTTMSIESWERPEEEEAPARPTTMSIESWEQPEEEEAPAPSSGPPTGGGDQ